jgi:hypothetical protein
MSGVMLVSSLFATASVSLSPSAPSAIPIFGGCRTNKAPVARRRFVDFVEALRKVDAWPHAVVESRSFVEFPFGRFYAKKPRIISTLIPRGNV